MKTIKKAFHEQVAENLIKLLKQGTVPWQKPWKPGDPLTGLPHNPTTGNRYKGINALQLMSQPHIDTRWLTYKQAESQGAQVRKGEKSTLIQYWKFTDERIKKNENGSPVMDSEGNPAKVQVKLERPRVFYASVFNGEQIDNLPELIIDPPQWNPIERAEEILQASNAKIQHGEYNRAFYRPATDSIHLPHKHQFETPDRYYATALHELGHWSGHESRLHRDLSNPFGSEGYAKEELRAEIASMLLGQELGIGHDPGQHAAYVASWIKALEEEPMEIFRAAADAEKIQEYVLAFAQQKELVAQEAAKVEQIRQDAATYTASLSSDIATVAQQNNEHIHKLTENMSSKDQDAIYLVSDALKFYRNFSIDNLEFEATAQDKLGFKIQADWNGGVRTQASVIETDANGNGYVTPAKDSGVDPQFWGLYAQRNDQTYVWVKDFDNELDALATAEKLSLIDAIAEKNEHEKAVKLARIHELRIGSDPHSTNEDILAAKEQVKLAEAVATQNDSSSEKRRQDMESKPTENASVLQNQSANQSDDNNARQYLAVPYAEKDQAKAAGARWDKAAKAWYVGDNADILALQRWLPQNVTQQPPAILPEVEFTDLLRANGCIVDGNHPIMDGNKQRIKVNGDKPGEKSGFYVAHLDGHPAGYFMNNRSGVQTHWKAKGYSLTDEQKAELVAQVAIKQQNRKAEQHELHLKVAKAITELLAVAPVVVAEHLYLKNKNARPGGLKMVPQNANVLPAGSIIKIGRDYKESKQLREDNPESIVLTAGDLLLPAQDINGKIWSVQTIQPSGAKFFATGSKKESNFYVVDDNNQGLAALNSAKAIIIAEGFATADTLSQALDYPVVAAFDSGNLSKVAHDLHEKYPHKPIIIAGDDDQHQESVNGKNPGREKALAAAELVNGVAVFATFAPDERVLQKLSDFNDLANKSVLGIDAVKRQVGSVVEKALIQAKVEKLETPVQKQTGERAQKQTVAR